MHRSCSERGFALISVLLLTALLMALALAHFGLTSNHLSSTRSSMDSTRGLYAAEAGLNLRADAIRSTFVDFQRPTGTAPDDSPGHTACAGGNVGSGDYRCISYALLDRSIATYLKSPGTSGVWTTIPRGEAYQNRSAQESRYYTFSVATNARGAQEAILEMHFKSRLVPVFQFLAFYNKDLEINPDSNTNLVGPIHTNGDLYLGSGGSLDFDGQLTSAGTVFQGWKSQSSCPAGNVRVYDPASLSALPACTTSRRAYTKAELAPWNGMVRSALDALAVPRQEELDPVAGATFWDRADLRVVLDVNGGTPAIQVRGSDNSVNATRTAALATCAGATATSTTFYNQRESKTIRMLDVNLQALLDCAHSQNLMGKTLDDATDGGLVFYFGVAGPDSSGINTYGVRIRNAAEIRSTLVGAPVIRGLTIATDQAAYVQGDFNITNQKPAAVLADSLNVLSAAWSDANSLLALGSRHASSTTINAALLAGTDTTGGAEGSAGRDFGDYAGGLDNFPRFHESWNGRSFTFLGSLVSLGNPRHVNGTWVNGAPQFDPPTTMTLTYDDTFDTVTLLPPLTPQFVYLKQELFVRKF